MAFLVEWHVLVQLGVASPNLGPHVRSHPPLQLLNPLGNEIVQLATLLADSRRNQLHSQLCTVYLPWQCR